MLSKNYIIIILKHFIVNSRILSNNPASIIITVKNSYKLIIIVVIITWPKKMCFYTGLLTVTSLYFTLKLFANSKIN